MLNVQKLVKEIFKEINTAVCSFHTNFEIKSHASPSLFNRVNIKLPFSTSTILANNFNIEDSVDVIPSI